MNGHSTIFKKKNLQFVKFFAMFLGVGIIGCTPLTQFQKLQSAVDYFGEYVPSDPKTLVNYLDLKVNNDVVTQTYAQVAVNSINDANIDDKFHFFKSIIETNIETLPSNFNYSFSAELNPDNHQSATFIMEVTSKTDGAVEVKKIVINNFKKIETLTEDDWQIITNNILATNDLGYLVKEDNDQTTNGTKDVHPDEARSNRFADTIINKYLEKNFTSPLVNLYFAGNFNAGRTNFNNPISESGLRKQTIENRRTEQKAYDEALEFLHRKEIQPIQNLVTNQIIDQGYSDAPKVRNAVQKLLFLAVAYKSKAANNSWSQSSQLKTIIREILDDLTTNWYYAGQQQYVNWWFYEIGIPKDFTKVLLTLHDVFTVQDFEKWLAPINYFLPNPRYGGASATAINGYKPVLKKRLQTGANVVDNSKPIIIAGVLLRDPIKLDDAISTVYDNLFRNFVKKGDGFYYDGSFIQHNNLAYVGSYGEVLFTNMAEIYNYLKASKFAIDKDARFINLYKFIELAVMPFMFQGSISDGLSGRSITRANHSDKVKGFYILGSLATFASDNAPVQYKEYLIKFIQEQLKPWTKDELKTVLASYRIRKFFTERLLEIKDKKTNGDTLTNIRNQRKQEDWFFYQTNYFNKYYEPSNNQTVSDLTGLNSKKDPNQFNVPIGVDLAEENNGLVFAKTQDRYVWKQEDFMFNINLHGRLSGFPESILKENAESYYQADGATLLHTTNNNAPYDKDYWVAINAEQIPGTSSFHTTNFDSIYNYRYPTGDKKNWTTEQKQKHELFEKYLAKKTNDVEKNLSLKTNRSFNNGIIFEKTGFIKSLVQNWNNTLITKKAYLMIKDQIIVIGNVDRTNAEINTTIANHMYTGTAKVEEAKIKQGFTKTKLNNKNNYSLFKFQNQEPTDINKQNTIGYVTLNNTQATSYAEIIEKNTTIAHPIRPQILLKKHFDRLTINHATSRYFSYSIIPNYSDAKKSQYAATLDNLKILHNDGNYILVSYKENQKTKYYLASFFYENKRLVKFDEENNKIDFDQAYEEIVNKGLSIPQTPLKFKIYEPTTMVFETDPQFNEIKMVFSNDWNNDHYSFLLENDYRLIQTRLITNYKFKFPQIQNRPEVFVGNFNAKTYFTVNNLYDEYSGYNHNNWAIIQKN